MNTTRRLPAARNPPRARRAPSSSVAPRAHRQASRARSILPKMNEATPSLSPLVAARLEESFTSTDGVKYDRKWLEKNDLDQSVLLFPTSKHKLDQLVRNGAVIIGDKLQIAYESAAGKVVKEGQV